MNLSALPDDQSRVGYVSPAPFFGALAMAEHIFEANNEPRRVLSNLDFNGLNEISEVLEEIGTDSACVVMGWLDLDSSIATDIQMVREIHAGAYGDSAQAAIKQAIETMARRRAERIVRGHFPNWSAE